MDYLFVDYLFVFIVSVCLHSGLHGLLADIITTAEDGPGMCSHRPAEETPPFCKISFSVPLSLSLLPQEAEEVGSYELEELLIGLTRLASRVRHLPARSPRET